MDKNVKQLVLESISRVMEETDPAMPRLIQDERGRIVGIKELSEEKKLLWLLAAALMEIAHEIKAEEVHHGSGP